MESINDKISTALISPFVDLYAESIEILPKPVAEPQNTGSSFKLNVVGIVKMSDCLKDRELKHILH